MDQNNQENKKIDLSNLLKDSGKSENLEEYRASDSYYPGTPKIIQWVIKYSGGLIKNEKQANYVLLGFVAVAIVITLVLIFSIYGGRQGTTIPPESYINIPQSLPNE